ncbi:unnamed protein product [Cyclocybe aegerita]|uniref:Uncharacterized protein n=1 Tax=Cyclocybe aegerita TaxID=1973307 RepID=A0A8S0WML0_CYCAE|nr:unnamed protein product [Cyclocybe aegerita]
MNKVAIEKDNTQCCEGFLLVFCLFIWKQVPLFPPPGRLFEGSRVLRWSSSTNPPFPPRYPLQIPSKFRMRYHTALPPRLNSQKTPQDPTVQRSPPTCELSLANASACTTSTDPEAMEVDLPLPQTPSTIQSSTEDGTVTGPASKRVQSSRKHSLLRSTVPRLEIFPTSDASAAQSNRGPPSPTEQSPPRKRTRTSALSSPSRPRPHRLVSLPTRPAPLPPSSTPLSPSFVASGRQLAPAKSEIAPVSSALPFSPILPTPNVVANLLPSAAQEQPHSTRFRRRKPPPSELKLLTSVYRSLVYGLEMRYPRWRRFAETRDADGTLARTYFDTQDALLAHHLKPYLLLNGASRNSMVVDVDLVARERVGSMGMDVDSETETSPRPGLPDSSTDSSILSYQRLVSALILRHHTYPRRLPGRIRKKGDASRKASALAKSYTFELESS